MLPEMPDKAIIIARIKKKQAEPSEPDSEVSDDSGDHEDKLSDIARDLLEAFRKKDAEELRDYLCEFITEHLKDKEDY